MSYTLYREDGAVGDGGSMSEVYGYVDGIVKKLDTHRPKVGCIMRVGSPYGRTYSMQDYWQTSIIEEILEEREDYVKFKTRNSIYEWRDN